MRALTAETALQAWERGQHLDPAGRVLALLSSVLPDTPRERLLRLPVGQRDALLLRLRQSTFGHQVWCFARCPRCQTALQFDVDLRDYDADGHLKRRLAAGMHEAEGFEVRFRLPDSRDLEAVAAGSEDVESARRMILERCVLAARGPDGGELSPRDLPETVVAEIGRRMEELDPLAELPLAITCDRCQHRWVVLFDVGVFLWHDVQAEVQDLLEEVHVLATAYGWSESEILSLSGARRKFYIERIPSGGSAA